MKMAEVFRKGVFESLPRTAAAPWDLWMRVQRPNTCER
jgi:hypothetical protein